MTQIRYAVAGFVVAGLVASGAGVGANTRDAEQSTKGQSVTLTSCVEKAQKPGTFILTHTADVPVHPATKGGRVVYWLDSVKDLPPHVGHQIRINGTITDVKAEEMEVKLGADNTGGWSVEIEGPGRDVRTTPEKASVSTTARKSGKDDIKTTLVKLKVTGVTMVADKCPAM